MTKKKDASSSNLVDTRQTLLPTELDFTFQQLLNSYIKNGLVLKIGAIPFAIWIILRAHCIISGKNAGKVFLSYGNIRKLSGFGVNTIRTAISVLEKEGLIKVFTENNTEDSYKTKRYYTVEFLVDPVSKEKMLAVPYDPSKAAETRVRLQKWYDGAGDKPSNVSILVDARQFSQNNYFVGGDAKEAIKVVEAFQSADPAIRDEVEARWISPHLQELIVKRKEEK